MKTIVMTGGGTAGHVTPNLALVPYLKQEGYEIFYIGSYNGIEKKMVENAGITYYGISSGKLRRYHDWQNFTDPFRVIKGFSEANQLLKHLKPDVVFSKGGFVSVPVVMAAGRQHIPAIIHESDMTPGLANKLAIPFATKVCCNFPETMNYLPNGKAVHTGSPIRQELFTGNKEAGLSFCGFNNEKPVMLIMGGSIGSRFINNAVWESLDTLLEKFQIVHLVGKGNINKEFEGKAGYQQYEFISEQLNDIFAMTDLMISRAGANSISEILALKIPNILIPLSAKASRGDQILNAESYEKQGFSTVLQEEDLTAELLINSVNDVFARRDEIKEKMASSKLLDANKTIIDLILHA
ncbi:MULTISPECIES: undecaprenyldiphospho-muramoylpentapeptide beta-N-acetylglucosaminyltransferase [Pseudobutyrivibrio]|uniref:UDP-N-acetylglucosamine--N-acetylmuramyl-(pentapeptide) pyrophosphoryl-undecaprenol N-acetylglucosamine transferase n=1 Tax=Pseudobutyrivibrio xylanivorans TaxID=185007 RepID=A0A1G5RXG8_PSEXY|nr:MULTISPECIES: undecaprenyldiphospho-muramoylpentapeptide beta-N-acetylglucosaminyltransferase [Pseudobutyrivibrio]MDC7278924.1 undecaprenyldiphospho-muramoylpentapeptide beta-N-acetylglucosaminyltransferase [Butyrivibrio fibrisolvens]SCZ78814.1 UDP-N-acetylglucosamine-N-acetylmuramylpentapeptide N-acetylglucosamine transferase [Pseudobutyrivibrio xylanivorans]